MSGSRCGIFVYAIQICCIKLAQFGYKSAVSKVIDTGYVLQ